jgi:hypothetical protein
MLGLLLVVPMPSCISGDDRFFRASSQAMYSVKHVIRNKRRCTRRGML